MVAMRVGRLWDGKVCPYCTRTMINEDVKLCPTRDHIKPKSRFGNGKLIVVCSECNYMKADLTLSEYLHELEEKNKALQEFIRLNTERLENIRFLLQIGIEE